MPNTDRDARNAAIARSIRTVGPGATASVLRVAGPAKFDVGDIVVLAILPVTGHTFEVTELPPDAATDPDPLVRIWPTDPGDVRGGQWISSHLLLRSDNCPEHCPGCGINLKAEGYPLGHKTDEGDQCEWSWARVAGY